MGEGQIRLYRAMEEEGVTKRACIKRTQLKAYIIDRVCGSAGLPRTAASVVRRRLGAPALRRSDTCQIPLLSGVSPSPSSPCHSHSRLLMSHVPTLQAMRPPN